MMELKISFLLMLTILTNCVQCLEDKENIFYSEERYVKLEEEKSIQPVKVRSHNWCLSLPPRCSNYRTEMRDVIKLQNVTKTRVIERCCEGYNNISLNNGTIVCSPTCRGGCGHGVCELPNECVCDIGYEGRHCSQRCRPRMYGKNCKNICKCRNRSLCDNKSGFCRCTSGWIGEFCENPCPNGQFGMMCQKQCECNNNKCDPETGECLTEHVRILFDISSHNRSSDIMTLSSDRSKAKHWIPVNGNGKIIMPNCSNPDRCEYNTGHGNSSNQAASGELNETNNTALIHELNSNLSNLTNELKKASDNTVAIVVNSSIEIHHIHSSVGDAETKHRKLSYLTPSSELSTATDETDNKEVAYDQLNEFGSVQETIDHYDEDSDEIDSIGGYNDVVHVFAMSSINTTKSEQIVTVPPMLPVTLILLIILCATFAILFGTIYCIRKSKELQAQKNMTAHDGITLSDQIVQKPLPEIPSFTQSITRRIMQQDFYDRPSNNKSVKTGLNKLGYCYAEDENNHQINGKVACDEHIYDEIKYSNYNCATTQR